MVCIVGNDSFCNLCNGMSIMVKSCDDFVYVLQQHSKMQSLCALLNLQ